MPEQPVDSQSGQEAGESERLLIPRVESVFGLDGTDFRVDRAGDRWEYTGPLDDITDWFRECFPRSEIWQSQFTAKIATRDERMVGSPVDLEPFDLYTSASTIEEAWRLHLGELLVNDRQPYAELGVPGQTLRVVLDQLEGIDLKLPDTVGPQNFQENILWNRWKGKVADGQEFIGFRSWLRELSTRRLVP